MFPTSPNSPLAGTTVKLESTRHIFGHVSVRAFLKALNSGNERGLIQNMGGPIVRAVVLD